MFKHLSKGIRTFQKGDTIIRQGENVDYLYFLQSGSCYRYVVTPKGDNVIYEIKEPDESLSCLIGVLALYTQSEGTNFTFVARTKCECLCIPAADFVSWAAERADVQNGLLRLAMCYYRELSQAYQSHQEGRIANRLCSILADCCISQDKEWIIEKKYSFSEMADMLGVHAVTVSRIVRYLCDEGILEKNTAQLRVLDMDRLLQYASNHAILSYK